MRKLDVLLTRMSWVVFFGLIVAVPFHMAFAGGPSAEPVVVTPPNLDELRALARLPKVHYSVPVHREIRKDHAVFSEFVRITGGCTVHPFWTSETEVEDCIALCKEHGAELAVYYSPFQRRFNEAKSAALKAGESFDAFPLTVEVDGLFEDELTRFAKKLAHIIALARVSGVHFGAVVLDQEMLVADDVTDGVVRWKHKQFWNVIKALAPHAEVIWYGRGGFREAATPSGWKVMPYTSIDVPGTCVTVPLYWITETHHWRKAVRLTHAANPLERIIPWVPIGWQWTRDRPAGRKGTKHFPTEASYILGSEINRSWFGRSPDRFLPNHEIPAVVLYWTFKFAPHFWAHFAAYVGGATNVR